MAKTPKATGAQPSTADADVKVVRANVNRQVTAAQNFVSLYTNDTQVQLSPWDVRLIFGVIVEPPASERPSIQITSVGEVRMSPQHAKKVALILLKQLQHYEETIGPIPVPD